MRTEILKKNKSPVLSISKINVNIALKSKQQISAEQL